MGRKTYSFGAAAVAAIASMSLAGIDNAGAFAQDLVAADAGADAAQNQSEDISATPEAAMDPAVEIVPQQPVFISQEVVQPIGADEPSESEQNAAPADSLHQLVGMVETDDQLTDQMHCLAGAIYFESRGEPLYGQLAVAEVVINRSQDDRWPASYCGVVYQRAQFSFVRGGQMPRIRTSSEAWNRAKAVAKIAHEDLWQSEANEAVYFHAEYARPRWIRAKTRVTKIDTHIFYR